MRLALGFLTALICATAAHADHRGIWTHALFDDHPLTTEIWDACAFEPNGDLPRYIGDDPVCADTFAYCDDLIHGPEISYRTEGEDPYAHVSGQINPVREQMGNCLRSDIRRYHLLFVATMDEMADLSVAEIPAEDTFGRDLVREDHAFRAIETATSIGMFCADVLDRDDNLRRKMCQHSEWYQQIYLARQFLNERWPDRP